MTEQPQPVPQLDRPEPATVIQATPLARLTVVEQVYHQAPDSDPTTLPVAFGRWLESDEQAVLRHTRVGPEWGTIDLLWLANRPVGMLIIYNAEQPPRDVIQPAEVLEEVRSRVVEVCFRSQVKLPDAVVRPGESMRLEPTYPDEILLRGAGGRTVKVTILVVPG